jgi:hypothetical protein
LSETQKEAARKRAVQTQRANDFLSTQFSDMFAISEVEKFDGENKLAWPIAQSKKKTSIVIHHTDDDYDDSFDAIQKIYKFHAITRQW